MVQTLYLSIIKFSLNNLFLMWEENMSLKPVNILAFISSLFFANMVIAADSDLIVFDWGGYEDPGFFGKYVEKYGDAPTYSFFSDEEEAFHCFK